MLITRLTHNFSTLIKMLRIPPTMEMIKSTVWYIYVCDMMLQ